MNCGMPNCFCILCKSTLISCGSLPLYALSCFLIKSASSLDKGIRLYEALVFGCGFNTYFPNSFCTRSFEIVSTLLSSISAAVTQAISPRLTPLTASFKTASSFYRCQVVFDLHPKKGNLSKHENFTNFRNFTKVNNGINTDVNVIINEDISRI